MTSKTHTFRPSPALVISCLALFLAMAGSAFAVGVAKNSVSGLTVTIPPITLPAAVALPNAATLPAISGLPGTGTVGTTLAAPWPSAATTLPITAAEIST